MQRRQPRSEINKNALSVLDSKILHARETGSYEDAILAKGLLRGLELAELFRGGAGAAAVRKLNAEIQVLIQAHEQERP